MFKNIFNTPESIRSAILGQDEIRARSQQGLQAVRSGVESLRTVLANNPAPSESRVGGGVGGVGGVGVGGGQARDSTGTGDLSRLNEAKTSTTSTTTTTRGRSGSWSLLPPSLTGRSHAFNSSTSSTSSSVSAHTERNRTGYRPSGGEGASETSSRPNSLTGSSSITESVAESIKSLSTGLGLAQFAGGLGLTGGSGLHQHHGSGSGSGSGPVSNPPSHPRRGNMDISQTSQSSMVTTVSGSQTRKHPMMLSNRGRVWTWNGQENGDTEDFVGGGGSAGVGLKTGAQTEEAARETEARLARLREQEDESLARSRRMPEVEQMAQRYQDSWKEIHEHTARNAEKADNADEILGKVLELCQRHVEASSLMEAECKGLKDLGKSLDDMAVVSGNIHKKLMGLEAMIEKLEEGHEEMSLADWKKSKVVELDKYMEWKRNELWDKAEVLSTRSEQFQKEEAARKLKQYQNQFEYDMAHFRRTQEEKEQELSWKAAQQDPSVPEDQQRDMYDTSKGSEDPNTASDGLAGSSSGLKSKDEFLFGARIPSGATVFATASKLLSSLESARRGQGANLEMPSSLEVPTPLRSPMPRTRDTSISLLALDDVVDWKDKDDLDNFLGPDTEENEAKTDLLSVPKLAQDSDKKEEEEDKEETIILQDVEYEDEASEVTHDDGGAEEVEDDDEETTEEESSEEEEDEEEELDPIAKARQARAAAAAAAAAGPKATTGSTISAFSALAKHASTS